MGGGIYCGDVCNILPQVKPMILFDNILKGFFIFRHVARSLVLPLYGRGGPFLGDNPHVFLCKSKPMGHKDLRTRRSLLFYFSFSSVGLSPERLRFTRCFAN